jgi:hypothetical protein
MNTIRTMQFSVVPHGTKIDNLRCPHERGKSNNILQQTKIPRKVRKAIISQKLTQW